jgi:hypothetical protein
MLVPEEAADYGIYQWNFKARQLVRRVAFDFPHRLEYS